LYGGAIMAGGGVLVMTRLFGWRRNQFTYREWQKHTLIVTTPVITPRDPVYTQARDSVAFGGYYYRPWV
jgi:hypothetical protein